MKIVIDIGGTTMRVAKTDGKRFLKISKESTPRSFQDAMVVLKKIILHCKESDVISSVCLGMPGFVDSSGMIVHSGMLKEWKGSNIFQEIKKYLNTHIIFVNDAALAAIGESVFGAGKNYSSVGYVTLSTGLGGAKVVNKVLSNEKEPGKIIFEDNKTAEDILSGTAVTLQTGKNPHDITDPAFWPAYHEKLVKYLSQLQKMWHVDVFVLGGGMVNHDHIQFEKLNSADLPPVKKLELGDEVGLWGGVAYLQPDFFWGAATAAHQIEGAAHNNWSVWESSEKRVNQLKKENKNPNSYISGKNSDHYNRYDEDFSLAESLSHNAYRFSVEWSRLEPKQGMWDEKEFDHYSLMIDSMKSHGLEPFMTLWHWTMPVWVSEKGGVAWSGFPEAFATFAEKCALKFGSKLNYMITLNEPEVHAAATYLQGVHPPAQKNFTKYVKSFRLLPKSHNLAFHKIKKACPHIQVGMATHQILFQSPKHFSVKNLLALCGNRVWNDGMLLQMKKHLDFIGVNFYFRKQLHFGEAFHQLHASTDPQEIEKREREVLKKDPHIADRYPGLEKIPNAVPYSDMGWELYPYGLGPVLSRLNKKYSLPLIVTENGLADLRDKYRAWYIKEAVKSLMQAKAEGINIFGYLHWSLLDNFEWQDGFGPRFGLIEINYETLNRTVRKSAYTYKKIIENNSLAPRAREGEAP